MAVESASFRILCDALQGFAHRPVRMLSLGYPDLLVEEGLLRAKLPSAEWLKPAPDAERVARWHNWTTSLYDTDSVFRGLGLDAVYVDIFASRGNERILDLNKPFNDPDMRGSFDIVYDGGTSEHCFNIGQVFLNIASAVRVGGAVIHINPMTLCNHGFWNLNPTTYIDFYSQNGFEIVSVQGLMGHAARAEIADVNTIERIQLPAEVRSLVWVRKTEDRTALVWPTQSKYTANRELKA